MQILLYGLGPHVPRAIELYKKIIAYSLGNFCTYGRFNLSGPKGFAPILNIEINQSGDFVTGKIIPIKQINRGYVYYDKEKKAINKIKELTKLDFPDSLIEIDNEGNINIK